MSRGAQNSEAFISKYDELRGEGMGVGQVFIFARHKFRLLHLNHQTAR